MLVEQAVIPIELTMAGHPFEKLGLLPQGNRLTGVERTGYRKYYVWTT